VAGYDKLLQVRELENPAVARNYAFEEEGDIGTNNVWSVTFSPNGQRLAAGSALLGEWTVEDGKLVNQYSGSGDLTGLSIAYSSNEDYIAATDRTGLIRVWDRATGKTILGPQKRKGTVPSLAFHPTDSRYLGFVRGTDVFIENISPAPVRTHEVLQGHHSQLVSELAFDPSGKFLVTRAGKRELIRWDIRTKNPTPFQTPTADMPSQANLIILPGEKPLVLCGCAAGKPLLWDLATGQTSNALTISIADSRCSALSADGRYLALTDKQNKIYLWDLNDPKEEPQTTWYGGPADIYSVAFQPGKRLRLATGSRDGGVCLWDAAEKKKLWSTNDHKGVVTRVAFSPDGHRLATASGDKTICLRDAANGRCIATLKGHSGYVSCVAYSPDGRRIASCAYDGTVKLWDAASGQEVLSLRDHASYATCVAFSPGDGTYLASCGGDGTVRLWEARPADDSSPTR
jgi:WD40 repeat protein